VSKKNKKIFKQKMRQMLSQMDNNSAAKQPQIISKDPVSTSSPVAPVAIAAKSVAPALSLVPVDVVRADLKKIGLLLFIMLLVIVAVTIISDKTTWLTTISDHLYNWAQLGS
jgi:hypothetical protein